MVPTGSRISRSAPALAGHVAPHAGLAVLGTEVALVAQVHQGVEALVGDHIDTAAITAVAAVGTAEGDVLLAAEADAAVAALARLDADIRFIYEFHLLLPLTAAAGRPKRKNPA